MLDHNASVANVEINVPLMVKYPGETQGTVVSTPVSAGVDLLPTMLDVVGGPRLEDLNGVSLRRPDPERFVLAETFRHPRLAQFEAYKGVERAIISDRFKVVRGHAGERTVYSVQSDGSERLVAEPAHNAAEALDATLVRWVAQAPRLRSTPANLDPETIEELRSLGYIR
jgi:arylsulfatase A-like enzyme